MGVDNAMIDIDAPEVPIMDGSAREYAQKILEVGLVEQKADRKYYEVTEKQVYTIPDKGVAIIIYPDDEFTVSVHVDYNSKVIGNQYATLDPFNDYAQQIAPCRTFVFLHELEPLLKMNLIKGGDLDNSIVVVENPVSEEQLEHLKKIFHKDDIRVTGGYLNNLQLRSSNELARHKLLDLLGDFALLGMRIKGRVWASRPGHYANTEFMKQLIHTIRRDGEKPAFRYRPDKPALLDVNEVRKLLPHRYPFLLVDKVFYLDNNSIGAIKNVTANEPQFTGHFPTEPVMPGVLLVEAMAQASGIIVLKSVEHPEEYSTYFLRIDNVRFKHKGRSGRHDADRGTHHRARAPRHRLGRRQGLRRRRSGLRGYHYGTDCEKQKTRIAEHDQQIGIRASRRQDREQRHDRTLRIHRRRRSHRRRLLDRAFGRNI